MNRYKKNLLTAVLTLFISFPGFSQSVWSPQTTYDSKAGIEIQIPSFNLIDADFPTSVAYLYSHYSLSEKYTLKLELPISQFSANNSSDNTIGNPYIGINIDSEESKLGVDIGIRLPLASSNNGGVLTGLLIENHDFAPFIPEAFAFVADVNYTYQDNSGLIINVGGGPQIIYPDDFSNAELFLKYFGQVLYNTNNATFGAGFTGQAIVTGENFTFSDSSIHGFGLLGSYDFGNITIGSSLKFPSDDGLNDIVNFVFGVNTSFSF